MDMSDARANFLQTNSNVAGYQNNAQINRYSIEHPQGKLKKNHLFLCFYLILH
jgi:hypothetical protein